MALIITYHVVMRIVLLLALASGCASPPPPQDRAYQDTRDAYERQMFQSNNQKAEQKLRAERADVESRLFVKDWQRWNNFYQNRGYTPEEAEIKANRIMRGR